MKRHGNSMERLRYRGPDIDAQGVRVNRFTIGGPDESMQSFMFNLRAERDGRGCDPGEYARLFVDNELWMSDTTSECRDHREPVIMGDTLGGRALVNGLGLGCVVAALLDAVDHVDVVEREQRVIDTVGAWYQAEYGDRLTIHHDDAYTIKWPAHTRWSVVWHDIWPTIGADNLPEMAKLHRRYGRRSDWQGSWCHRECKWMRRQEDSWERDYLFAQAL